MSTPAYIDELIDFLNASPTAYHAVSNMESRLLANGFIKLEPRNRWDIKPCQGYYTIAQDSSIAAFWLPPNYTNAPLHLVGSHTDSPCLRVKPNPEIAHHGVQKIGVEVYGGALLHPWFDRDLSIAGQLVGHDAKQQLTSQLIDLKQPVAYIPSLAIHLKRNANKDSSINPQTDLPVLLGQQLGDDFKLRELLLASAQEHTLPLVDVIDYDLSLYDTQPATQVGWRNEWLASARLDNLLSCFVGMQALLQASNQALQQQTTGQGMMLVCNDHEEVGSQSAIGADGSFLPALLARIYQSSETLHQVMQQSMLVSADNAHAVHPNFANYHDEQHSPYLNKGPVIKINHNQRYATSALTSAWIREIASRFEVNLQTFVTRSDMACGSTIGPITAAKLGIQTVDIGLPTLAMHSIRELAGCDDIEAGIKLLAGFYSTQRSHPT